MYGDNPEIRPGSAEPVPPVRARPPGEELTTLPRGDLPLVAPVRSGFFEAAVARDEPSPAEWSTAAESTESATAEFSESESELTWYGDEDATPWSEAAGEGGAEEEEIILEVGPPPVTEEADIVFETSLEVEDEGEIVLDASVETVEEEIVLEAVSPVEDESPRAAAPPLSPWDLGAASSAIEGAEERSARARAEWEAFGQALSQSLAASGGREIELTDEIAARLEATGAWEHAPEVPLFPGPSRPSEAPIARPRVPSGLADLASRLEAFAERLRAEGADALTQAQTAGDRVDSMLAAIAAGFLAGRGE